MRILLSFSMVAVLFSCAITSAAKIAPASKLSTPALQRLSWLIGTWEAKLGDQVVYESWRAESTSKLRGLGFTISGTDTTISEKLLIEVSDSGLYYISDVAHNPAPVYFKMAIQDSFRYSFENLDHDFPTRIIYRQISNDSLHARIEGKRKGKETGVDYLFKRIK